MDTNRKLKKKPMKIEDMTKEQLRQAIVKKQECNNKAQQIVESLLENNISEDYFLRCLPDINQSHLEDVIEERSIIHLCGYPLCENPISEREIPKQKYRISTKTNKVYDITARKTFCSNSCYKSAMYVKNQMLTSPLWFREYEEVPKFVLLGSDTGGSLGQEIDVAIVEKLKIKPVSNFASINDFASASLNEMSGCEEDKNNTEDSSNRNKIKEDRTNSANNEKSEDISIHNHKESAETVESKNTDKLKTVAKTQTKNPLNIVGDIIEKKVTNIDPILNQNSEPQFKKENKKIYNKKQPAIIAVTIEVEKCLADWFSLDTLLFLFGEEKVKEMVQDKGECIKEYLNNYAKGIFYNSNTYDQYQVLCRKLNMLEIEDRRYDSQTLQREMKPLPDYSILQEESKKMTLKVKAYLSGVTDVPEPESSQPISNETPENDSHLTQLPLIDSNAQNALRRKIVCEHLNKVLPDLLRSLGLLTLSISSDVRLLVNTFKLKANNIMFKPIQWTLIAIVFIKLLSLRDQRLEYLLEQQTTYQHMQLLLLSYKQDGGYLERLIAWLTDIDRLLNTDDTQLTIE